MKTIATANILVFIVVVSIAMYTELNLQKWRTWLLGLYGFLSFFLLGIVGKQDLYKCIILGAVGVVIVLGGIITYWNRERARKWLREREEK